MEEDKGKTIQFPTGKPEQQPQQEQPNSVEPAALQAEEQEQLQVPQTVQINPKAVITWYDAEGKSVRQESMFRSFPVLADFLEEDAMNNHEPAKIKEALEQKIEITLQLLNCAIKPPADAEDQTPRTRLTIRSGKVCDVIEYLRKKTVSPQEVLLHIQAIIYSMADVSMLKGVLISVVMEDAKALGFGFVTESAELTDQDVIVLTAAASAQTDLFKSKMREKRKMTFPDDSPIVAATGADIARLRNNPGPRPGGR